MYTQALDMPDTAADKTPLLKAVASPATPAELAHQSHFDAMIDADGKIGGARLDAPGLSQNAGATDQPACAQRNYWYAA